MKKVISVILCLVMIFSFSACSLTSGNAIFTIGIRETVNTFNPLLSKTDAEKIISTNCFEGLLRFDEHGKINLAGATAYTIEKDGLSYIFKLNPKAEWYIPEGAKTIIKNANIKYFNTSITAEDYVYGFQKFQEENPDFNSIKSINVVDDFTIEITLAEKDLDLLYKLAALPIYPCNKSFIETSGNSYATTSDTILYNGPYYVKESSPAETVLIKNPHYNGNIQIQNKKVLLYTTGTEEALKTRFNDGSYNIYIANSSTESIAYKHPATTTFSEVWGIAFNCKSKLCSQSNFREILASSINLDNVTFPDFAIQEAKFLYPANFSIGDATYGSFENNLTPPEFNADNAVKALDTIQQKYGIKSYSVTFAAPEEMKTSAEKIIADWKNLFGEKINFTLVTFPANQAKMFSEKGEYDVAVIPINANEKTATSIINSLSGAPCYYGGKTIQNLKGKLNTIPEESFKVHQKAEKHIIEHNIFIPLFYTGKALYINEGFSGIYLADGGRLLYFHAGHEV